MCKINRCHEYSLYGDDINLFFTDLSLTAVNLTSVLLDKEVKGEVLPTDSLRLETPETANVNANKGQFII